jgi:hypoxanthine phosphoribosyltransferase
MVEKIYVTYNDVHKLCQEAAPRILADFKPHLMIAIGGGGYVPARILRSFLKAQPGSGNIPIQAIGLSLYEKLSNSTDTDVEGAGTQVKRTQWLDLSSLGEMADLVGKRVLIVDEVDDTRTTLEYAVKELEKDVEAARAKMGSDLKTEFGIFVLHVRFSCLTPIFRFPVFFTNMRPPNRTRTSKRRAHSPPNSWRTATWPPGRSATSGSATRGRPLTSTSTTGWPPRRSPRRPSECGYK